MFIRRIFANSHNFFKDLERSFIVVFGRVNPAVCLDAPQPLAPEPSSFLDSLKDSFLYAVPKSRRTVEKRRCRKFGWPSHVWKPFVPKTNVIVCRTCGHYQEVDRLCPNCYARVKKETEAIQNAIQDNLKLEPVTQEVVVLYEDDIQSRKGDFYQGKRIVEVKKKRPSWYCDNLLQRSTERDEKECETKDLKPKPTELA